MARNKLSAGYKNDQGMGKWYIDSFKKNLPHFPLCYSFKSNIFQDNAKEYNYFGIILYPKKSLSRQGLELGCRGVVKATFFQTIPLGRIINILFVLFCLLEK